VPVVWPRRLVEGGLSSEIGTPPSVPDVAGMGRALVDSMVVLGKVYSGNPRHNVADHGRHISAYTYLYTYRCHWSRTLLEALDRSQSHQA